jgi:hypothetical protein
MAPPFAGAYQVEFIAAGDTKSSASDELIVQRGGP